MSEPLHPDDPRLTAYALGELNADDRLLVEQWLAENPAARAEIEQVQALAVTLTAQLQAEPVPSLSGVRPDCVALMQPTTAAKRTHRAWRRAAISVSAMSVCAVGLWGGKLVLDRLAPPSPAVAANLDASHSEMRSKLIRATSGPGAQLGAGSGPASSQLKDQAWDVREAVATGGESHPANGSSPADEEVRRWTEVSGRRSKYSRGDGAAEGLKSGDQSSPPAESEFEPLGTATEYAAQDPAANSERGRSPGNSGKSSGDQFASVDSLHPGEPQKSGDAAPSKDGEKGGSPSTKLVLDGSQPAGGGNQTPEIRKGWRYSGKESGGQGNKPGESQPAEVMSDDEKSRGANTTGKPIVVDRLEMLSQEAGQQGQSKSEPAPQGRAEANLARGGSAGEKGRPVDQKGAAVKTKLMVTPRIIVQEEQVQLARVEGEAKSRELERKPGTDAFYYEPFEAERLRNSNAETYAPLPELPFVVTAENPLSTFGIDVDTASYANIRRFLRQGQLPPAGAVRLEEMLNYFTYEDPTPTDDKPFAVRVETGACPWTPGHQLVRVALRGRDVDRDKRPHSNLVFLVDVSGSMQAANKLPLVQSSLQLLVDQLNENDNIAIVTYSNEARVALESTAGNRKDEIKSLIQSLHADGSTNGAGGIQLAYRMAASHFLNEGTNRVILCTDGDFNVGVSSDEELSKMIAEKAQSGVFLSVFGFGMGNLKDNKLESLADKGNGQYGYIDDQAEAHKVFVEELFGTLLTIAKDVKLQVEFDKSLVASYRLLGYENRQMAAQEFRNDKKDAGEMGSGHRVTALYEITPVAADPAAPVDAKKGEPLEVLAGAETPVGPSLLTVHVRYKQPRAETATEFHVAGPNGTAAPSRDFQWTTAVAAWGLILRNSQFKGQASFDMVQELASAAKGEDSNGRRREFVELVNLSKAFAESHRRHPGGSEPATTTPTAPPEKLSDEAALAKASVNGKYARLVEKLTVEKDYLSYGAFSEYGHWTGTSYAGNDHLPEGHWVYVYPNWYIWGDLKQEDKPK